VKTNKISKVNNSQKFDNINATLTDIDKRLILLHKTWSNFTAVCNNVRINIIKTDTRHSYLPICCTLMTDFVSEISSPCEV